MASARLCVSAPKTYTIFTKVIYAPTLDSFLKKPTNISIHPIIYIYSAREETVDCPLHAPYRPLLGRIQDYYMSVIIIRTADLSRQYPTRC